MNSREERHPKGAYYLEWREGGKRVRRSVGHDTADANARRLRKESELNAFANDLQVTDENEGDTNGRGASLADAVHNFLEEKSLQRKNKKKTHADYATALGYFRYLKPSRSQQVRDKVNEIFA